MASCTLIVVPNFTPRDAPLCLDRKCGHACRLAQAGYWHGDVAPHAGAGLGSGMLQDDAAYGAQEGGSAAFYENAGFKQGEKTGFVVHPDWYG